MIKKLCCKFIYKLALNIATLGYLGYLPAPGTCGSIFAFFIFIILKYLGIFSLDLELLAIILFAFFALVVIKYVINNLDHFDNSLIGFDPKEIIIDEVSGCFIALYGLTSFSSFIWAFILFRFFDITKTAGISVIEKKFRGPLGVLLDDIVAGVYANIVVKLMVFYGFV